VNAFEGAALPGTPLGERTALPQTDYLVGEGERKRRKKGREVRGMGEGGR